MQRLVREMERLDPSVCDRTAGLETAVVELQELERSLADYAAELDLDPAEAAALEERIGMIESLKRKYGPTLVEVLERRERGGAAAGHDREPRRAAGALEAEVKKARTALDKAGRSLGTLRRKAAPRLAKEIAGQLHDLGFKQSTFEVQLERQAEPGANGFEAVEFRFGPEPGRAGAAAAADGLER